MYLLFGSVLFGRHLYFSSSTKKTTITSTVTSITNCICTPKILCGNDTRNDDAAVATKTDSKKSSDDKEAMVSLNADGNAINEWIQAVEVKQNEKIV